MSVVKALVIEGANLRKMVELVTPRLTIGRGPTCDVVLADESLMREHVEVECREHVTFRARGADCRLNGVVTTVGALTSADTLSIGLDRWTIRLEDVPGLDEVRLERLEHLASGEATRRAVFADWLESRGELEFAEYVRAEVAFRVAPTEQHRAALEAITAHVEPGQRAQVARALIDFCNEPRCSRDWSSLKPTAEARVRGCQVCAREVMWCDTVREATRRTAWRGPVAIEPSRPREPGDLEPLVMTIG